MTFLNSFAVEGHYFNFTTPGQWLWDELQVRIPRGVKPYPLVDQISEMITRETASNAEKAEQDWERVTHRYGVRPLSAQPVISVKSADEGVEVTVRYIARVMERSELRTRLSHAAVKLIHAEGREGTEGTEGTEVSASDMASSSGEPAGNGLPLGEEKAKP